MHLEVNKFLRLPDSLLMEILAQWVSLKDFASLDLALCNKEARESFQKFLAFQSLHFSNSSLNFADNQWPVSRWWSGNGGNEQIVRRNLYLPIRFCVKRNLRVPHIALRFWPFVDMEHDEWLGLMNATDKLSLNVIEAWELIAQLGWSCFLSEFRNFHNVRKLNIMSYDLSYMSSTDIYVNNILTAAQERWHQPLEELSLSFASVQTSEEYDDGSFKLSLRINPLDLSAWENLRSLKLHGSWLMFMNNSTYRQFLWNIASLQSGALESISLDCDPTYSMTSIRPIFYALQNTRELLEQPAEKLTGLRNVKTIEGVDAFIYPILFVAPKLEDVRILVGDKFLMGMARHSPKLPHEIAVPHHTNDVNQDLEEDPYNYDDEDDPAESANELQADFGEPWAIPKLSQVKVFNLTIDGRKGMMVHASFPVVLGPFLRESGMLSTIEKLYLRMSIASDVVRCDIVEFFQSVSEGRADGRVPSDALLKLRTLEVADFVYLFSSCDSMQFSPFATVEDIPIYPVQTLDFDHSMCKFITDAAPNLTELSYHPERDRENWLYHQRRFRVQSILPLAKQLTVLHVDEVYRVQVPRVNLRNQFPLLSSFEKLQHITLRDSGLFFNDDDLIPVLKALPGLLTLVLAVDNFLTTVMESLAEYRQALRNNELGQFKQEYHPNFGGSPGHEIVNTVNPSGNITTKTLRTIAKHNTRLRVLLLDIPCHPEDDVEALAEETANMTLSDAAAASSSTADPWAALVRNADKHTPEYRLSTIEPVLFELWKSLPHVKSRDQLYVRVEPRHYGPDLWKHLFATESRHALPALRTQRWTFCRDLRTALLTRYEAWKSEATTNTRPFTLEVIKSPLYMYRYETRSGQQFIDTHGNNAAQQNQTSNQAGYANASASAREEEPVDDYDDGASVASSNSNSSEGFGSESSSDDGYPGFHDDHHSEGEAYQSEESPFGRSDDEDEWETDEGEDDEGEWSDVDEDD